MAETPFIGRWVRSYDETVEGAQVYRREDYPLSPARGRAAVEILVDGTFVDARIGPIEGSPPTIGRWTLSPDAAGGSVEVEGRVWLSFVVEACDDGSARLVVRRP